MADRDIKSAPFPSLGRGVRNHDIKPNGIRLAFPVLWSGTRRRLLSLHFFIVQLNDLGLVYTLCVSFRRVRLLFHSEPDSLWKAMFIRAEGEMG